MRAQNTKKNGIIVKIAILSAIVTIVALSYYFPDSMLNIIQLRAQSDLDIDASSLLKMIEIKGESYIQESQTHSDAPIRAAAIVDAIRLYSRYQSLKSDTFVTNGVGNELDWVWGDYTCLQIPSQIVGCY